jgi:hypothetical protein
MIQQTKLGARMKIWQHSPYSPLRAARNLGGAALLAVLVALAACSVSPLSSSGAAGKPITEGQKYVMATHSFNVFIGPTRSREPNAEVKPGPLAALAEERGKKGHENLAVQMIGGSTPMQHWNQGDGDDSKNIAKVALKKGGVDVFTMSPNARMPEEGIDLFGDLVIKTNPKARILVQNSWSAWDGNGTTPSVGGTGKVSFATEDHNKADITTIDSWLASLEAKDGYMQRMRKQLEGINQRAGHQMTYVVPSAVAVYNLRKEILKGTVPGVKVQADIFRDGMGHPKTPLANLVTYAWFAAMYRESPLGLKSLIDVNDPTSAPRERMLQQIAWNAVIAEPMSGVKGKPVKVDPNG